MKVVEISITDIRSITQMVMKPGALNIISGDNGEGKTSILMAIRAVFEKGHRPTLRRNLDAGKPLPPRYAKKGEVRMVVDDGGLVVITRTITETRSRLDVERTDGQPVLETPQVYVEKLAAGFGFDPLGFVEAKPKERLAYLQSAFNITFTPEEVSACCRLKPSSPVDLDGLELIRKQVYDARTKENTLAKQAQGTVDRLTGVLAEDEATDWAAEAARIQGLRDDAQAELNKVLQKVSADAKVARQKINDDIQAKIAELEKERRRQLDAVDRAEKESIATHGEMARAGLEDLAAQHATAEEKARKIAQNDVVRQEIETAAAAAEKHKAASTRLTANIEAIDALKKRKLKSLEDSIPGMEPRDGELFCDGIPFDDLNTGEQYLKAFQVAALQPGELGLMIADKAEHLGPANWDQFQDAALQSGFQIFVTRVTPGPLEVQAIGQ